MNTDPKHCFLHILKPTQTKRQKALAEKLLKGQQCRGSGSGRTGIILPDQDRTRTYCPSISRPEAGPEILDIKIYLFLQIYTFG
jgi:hypothetical protein